MALTKIIIGLTLIAVSQAGYARSGFDDDEWPRFPKIQMPTLPFAPMRPFQPFRPFRPFAPRRPTPPFPPSMIHVPSPSDIANMKPGSNQIVNGIAVRSSSKVQVDKDGNVVKTGGTTVVTNENGDVKEFTVGDSPPDINEKVEIPSIPKFEMPEFQFPEIVMPEMNFKPSKPFKPIKPVIIEPVSREDIKTYVPGSNENFVGVSSSSFSHSSNINGEETRGGGSSIIVNRNGEVEVQDVRYGDEKRPKREDK